MAEWLEGPVARWLGHRSDPAPARDALHRIIEGHMPYPAVIAGPYGELVAGNRAVSLLTEGAAPWLLAPPVNVLRLALHPDGMAPRVANLGAWGRHVTESLRLRALRSPDPRLDELIAELDGYVPHEPLGPDALGFAVPLRLRYGDAELRLLTTLTSFATAVDVTLAEPHLEAFPPADEETAEVLSRIARDRY